MTETTRTLKSLISDNVTVVAEMNTTDVVGITADSRLVKPGFVFFALKGVNLDATAFIQNALEAGAVAVVTDKETIVENLPVPLILSDNPRRELSLMASRFYPQMPKTIAAITGTSGKTSVASFLRQIWTALGYQAASIGTVGVISPKGSVYGSLTTPDPVTLHQTVSRLAEEGVTHLAIEASSHGLDQYRLDGLKLSLGAFTNLGRDHMDYHADIDEYFDAKMRLFEALLPGSSPVIANSSTPFGREAMERAEKAGLKICSVGDEGHAIHLASVEREGFKQRLTLDFGDGARTLLLPLVGQFQIENALTAAGLALASGGEPQAICTALENLQGEAGRLEYVGTNTKGALIFIDYAHKVEAVQNVLQALRPYADNRLIIVFGAGGDRDQGKRPLMGKAANDGADLVIVTDDNPRGEDPALIRSAIMAEVESGVEIGDREEAIRQALSIAGEGDVVVIAGKGHETGQIVGDKVLPFSDHEVVARILGEEKIDAD